jgi:2-alkyl-3-oxoalkanoate reductase
VSREGLGAPVLVTGATGFLGGHLAAELRRRGQAVRALTRRESPQDQLTAQGVEVVRADLLRPETLLAAAAGCRAVFHCAGRVSDWGARRLFQRANVEGTRNILAACQHTGVARLVHVSSLTVLGLPRDGRSVDEGTPCPEPRRGDHYSESKLAGEREVRAAHGRSGLATVVIRPGAIWGPGDPNVLPRIVTALRRGVMPYIGGGENLLGLSHVRNLVHALILAAEAGAAAGELYHVTDGEEITARQALDDLAAALSLPRPRRALPFWAVYAAAACVEGSARLLRRSRPPSMSRYGVRFVACHCRYDTAKARRELGYRPVVAFSEAVAALPRAQSPVSCGAASASAASARRHA